MRDTSLESVPSGGHVADAAGSPTRALVLATISFALSFAAWGLVGGLASVFNGLYRLTASETAFLVAVPVLLGSLARLPMGMLTDRFGGRVVFTALLAFSSLAAFVVSLTGSYGSLLVAAFLIGMAGSSFAVGAAFVSRWTPAARQGTALGVYGLGTMGQSLAVFVGPLVAARLGWEAVFRGTGALLLGWAVAYLLIARNPPKAGRPATVAAMMAVLRNAPTAWLLGAFYFLTFGGFVAFSVYLPTLLRAEFGLAPADAGFRAAGFVGTRHADAARRWMARGPDRRCPGPVLGLRRRRPVLTAPDVAVNGAVHGRRARVRDADGIGQRRGLQTGAGALPERYRDRDRPRWRSRRAGRVLPAASTGSLQRSPWRPLARVPPVVRDCGSAARGQPACLPPRRRRVDAVPAGGCTSSARTCQSWRVGRSRHGHSGGGDRRRVAQPAAFRRGAHRLHVRDALRRVRDQLSLRDVAAASAHTHVLAPRVASVLLTARTGRQHGQSGTPRAAGVCRQRVHLPARPAPRARALADHVGLPDRCGDHVPARLGLDSLRDGPWRPAHVPDVRVRHSDAGLPSRVRHSLRLFQGLVGRRSSSLPA